MIIDKSQFETGDYDLIRELYYNNEFIVVEIEPGDMTKYKILMAHIGNGTVLVVKFDGLLQAVVQQHASAFLYPNRVNSGNARTDEVVAKFFNDFFYN